MAAPGTLKDILDAAGFERTEERELRYKGPIRDLNACVASGLRSAAKELEGLPPGRMAALEAQLSAAWKRFEVGGVVQVPNYARIGLGWTRS